MNSRGQAAETAAAHWLEQAGLVIEARNWKSRFGEIDIIAREGDTLVFVEVRARRQATFGGAASSIDAGKRHRLELTAQQYLCRFTTLPPCRFDAILFEGHQPVWLKNIFD